ACSTWPNTTCLTWSGATPARSSAPAMAVPPSSVASSVERAPPIFPNGVRPVPRMTVLGMRPRIEGGPRRAAARHLLLQLAHWQHDPSERLVGDAREGCIPRCSGSRYADPAARVDDRIGAVRIPDAEQEEGRRQQQEYEVHGHGDPERRDPHVRREDAPRDQVEADGLAQMRGGNLVRLELLQDEERDPERPE